MYLRTLETQVIPATRENLERFTLKELMLYARGLGLSCARRKSAVVDALMESGKATMLAQLGN